jgi:hypothetical protein
MTAARGSQTASHRPERCGRWPRLSGWAQCACRPTATPRLARLSAPPPSCATSLRAAPLHRQLHGANDYSCLLRALPVGLACRNAPTQVGGAGWRGQGRASQQGPRLSPMAGRCLTALVQLLA